MGERFPDAEEVGGSKPPAPTRYFYTLTTYLNVGFAVVIAPQRLVPGGAHLHIGPKDLPIAPIKEAGR